MRVLAIGVICFSLLGVEVLGQEANVDRSSLTTEVFQLALRNIQLRGLYRKGRWSYGLHVGYRPSFGNRTTITEANGFFGGYAQWLHGNGVFQAATVGPILRYYVGNDRRGWLELELMYRHWWYTKRDVEFDGWRTQYEGQRSEQVQVFAWKMLWGGTIATNLTLGTRARMIFEGFGGVGARNKLARWTMHEGMMNGEHVTDSNGSTASWVPSLHMGIRLGIDRAVRLRDGLQ
jgi:hypothetical protein